MAFSLAALGRSGGFGRLSLSVGAKDSSREKEGAESRVLSLGMGETIQGTVKDPDGKPVAGAEIWFWFPRTKQNVQYPLLMQLYGPSRRKVVTGNDGSFHLNIPAEASIQLTPTFRFKGRMLRSGSLRLEPDSGRAEEPLEFEIPLPEGWDREEGKRN